ncbi:glycosyltransferase family 4 protein [uncultured Cohaesibacter sp.]|uniref:glycosyltransferase family 4 protein n=1 Tax=uncultured Cohaesibacter sp. TaxID=1002546 RepID=UPI0029C671BA|nr:glycosyltransferase family 4 protein [uncultured Cohaesibacter sp.]
MRRKLTFAYPGDLNLKTGGYGYDRAMIAGLKALGWDVDLLALGDGFPAPEASIKREAERLLSALPDGLLVMIDGLAFGILDQWAEREAHRLCIVALVHHPLALESGLGEETQDRLRSSERKALAATRHVVVTSPNTGRELVARFEVPADKVTIALPGTERAPVSSCNGSPPHILSIGTLIPRKGHDVLINALKRIEDLSWTATIVGSKSLHPATTNALQAQIADLGLAERVLLHGECDDVRAFLACADIFALASRYEGYGMVFAEALSQGVPVVACNAGAIPDVVPEDAGLLVPVDDVEAFANALRSLLEDKALHQHMALGARRAGEALPGWDDTSRIISSALEDCR